MCHMTQMQGMAGLLVGVGIPERLSISLKLQCCNVVADH